MRQHWNLCGSTADYLAQFALQGRGAGAMISASTVFNELVENAVKYAQPTADTLWVRLWLNTAHLRVQLVHTVQPAQADRLKAVLRELPRQPTEQLIRAQPVATTASGLGLASLVHEHGAGLDLQVDEAPEGTWVTLTAEFPVAS